MAEQVNFTENQLRALDLNSGKLVVAGAGSGKTTVLAERYLRLLESGLEPSQIVAMTFTRKAAASLRAKVYAEIQRRETEDSGQAVEWRERRDAMRDARISTIHSFCGNILRAYPQLSGVDPEVAVGPNAGLQQLQLIRDHIRILAYQRDEILHNLLAVFTKGRQQKVEALCLVLMRNPQLFVAVERAEQNADAAEEYLRQSTQSIAIQFNQQDYLQSREIKHHEWLQALAWARRIVAPLLSKREEPRAALSFDDLEHTALAFLQANSRSSHHLRTSIKALLVDEFQDTSLLQWQIIRELALNEHGDIEGRKLFLVGDEKQSIYSFRDANVTVLHHAQSELCGQNGQVEEVRLAENFRTRPSLMRTLNPILDRLLRISSFRDSAFVAQPQDMEPGREFDRTGEIETALVLAGQQAAPMEYVVDWIRRNVVPEEGLQGAGPPSESRNSDITNSEKEIFTYRDVAILLKTRTRLPELELELQLAGIPYSVNAGQGFFTRPEVLDLINLIHAFADQRDQLARVALLRSPMFGLSDSAVAALYMNRDLGSDPWQHWVNTGEEPELFECLDARDRAVLDRARPVWMELQRLAGLTDVVEWIRLALDRSGAWGAYSVGRRGRQALANIAQFLELVREYTIDQGPGLRALADRLEVEIEREDGETDAEADVSGGSGVQIMTIHSAKGLEFPVVILALSDTPQKLDPRLTRGNLVTEDSDFRSLTEPRLYALAEPFIDKKCVTNLHDVMYRFSSQEEELAEQLRLLYVAATRARDRLLVVTHAKRKAETKKGDPACLDPGNRSASDLWLQACDLDLEGLHERCGESSTGLVGEQPANDFLKTATDMRFSWFEARARADHTQAKRVMHLPVEPPEPDEGADPGVRLAVSRKSVTLQLPLEAFAAWIANPSQKNLDILLHLGAGDDDAKSSFTGGNGQNDAFADASDESNAQANNSDYPQLPRLSGTLFHNTVQRFGPGVDWATAKSWLYEQCASITSDAHLQRAMVDRLKTLVGAGSAHEWGLSTGAQRELPVMLKLGAVTLRGRIDLAWQEGETAVALDLKTNDVPAKKTDELTKRHGYDHQAKLYAMAYASSLGVNIAEGRLLFLPSLAEKHFDLGVDAEQYYRSRAAELVSLVEQNHHSTYSHESI